MVLGTIPPRCNAYPCVFDNVKINKFFKSKIILRKNQHTLAKILVCLLGHIAIKEEKNHSRSIYKLAGNNKNMWGLNFGILQKIGISPLPIFWGFCVTFLQALLN